MTTDNTPTETMEQSAGSLLKAAREQKQWSQKEVASQLNLRLSLIESMETDQYEASILPTFIRGYLRSYARLLKISEQQVLAAYERHHGNQAIEPRAMHSFSNRTEKEATESRFMLLTYLVGAILLGLLVLWWWQTHWLTDDTNTAVSERLSAPLEMVTAVEPETTPTSVTEPQILPEQPELITPIAEPAVLSEPSSSAPAQDQEALPADAAIPDSQQLTMRFADDCWIDVVDADGSRVAFGTKRAGYQLQVQGRPPFTVTLGNPSVVEITLDAEPVDMSGFRSGRVAKFSVPLQD
ncbi:DUF4115 domain-containing protein [Alkalimonas sp. MEB108]|uniref:DUF4115 domain-containing protein n=1 Tax=Alkalimonas cellulosilytica TaxID=3058395 RepID=A0ABU7J3C1_9GAMM|nr:RodZ domain-containing protein [Alkalimonas sp. MEB108]MEE2000989.1 DUF4115 domain-containing protein [Alkalimonas sp. MEB108]